MDNAPEMHIYRTMHNVGYCTFQTVTRAILLKCDGSFIKINIITSNRAISFNVNNLNMVEFVLLHLHADFSDAC